MIATANTRVSFLRGTTTDDFGDEADTDDPYLQGEPAQITEKSRSVYDKATSTSRVISTHILKVKNSLPIRDTDRVLDESSNEYFAISTIKKSTSIAVPGDLEITLNAVN